MELGRLAIAKRDGSGFVEQQNVDVAGSFDCAARHRDDVALNHAVHACDADGGEQAADRRGNQAHEQRDENENGLRRAGIDSEGLQRHDRQKENDREASEQNVERDFVRRFLTRRAFYEANHAVEKCFAGIRRDADLDLVGEHPRAAGNGAAVAAGFANDRSGFAGDRGFVHGGDAFDHFAIARDEFSGDDDDHVAGA